MGQSEINYLKSRADEEMDLAIASTDPIAANIHRQLASLYARRASEEGQQPILHIVSPATT